MKSTIIIPTFNEAENLPDLVPAILNLPIPGLGILIVDDNSPDGTGRLAEQLASDYTNRVHVIHREGKLGLGTAYLAGINHALDFDAQFIGQMDADFSHPPERIIDLHRILKECDIAIGSRYIPGGSLDRDWPIWRKALSKFANQYARTILRMPIRDITGGFRLWRRKTLSEMPLQRVRSNGYVFQIEMAYLAHRLGYSFGETPIYFADRRWGQSKMSLRIQIEAAIRVWMLLYSYRDIK